MLMIKTNFRNKHKTKGARWLRSNNKCPAIIYKNPQFSNLSISLDYHEILHPKIYNHFYKNNIIKLIIDTDTCFVVKIQDIQYHPIKSYMMHIDFLLVQ